MSGSDKTKEQSQQQATSANTIDPQELKMLQDNYAGAQSRANSLTPYSGPLTAGFNPTQVKAQGILTGIGTDPRYAASNAAAVGSAQGVLGADLGGQITPKTVTPHQISAPTFDAAQISMPTPITAGQLSDADLSKYQNPYTRDVINTTIDANERARRIAGVADSQQATASKAFGGSRSGVLSSLTNEAYDRNGLAAIAALNKDNYDQSVAGATGDITRKFAADQFNGTADQAAQVYNAGNRQQGGIFSATNAMDAAKTNQTAGINTDEFNTTNDIAGQQGTFANMLAAAGFKLNAAGQIVQLNNSALASDTAQAGILSSVGDTQQAQQQQEYTDAINAWAQGQQLTIAQQQLLNSALGLIPNQQTVSSSGSSSGTSTTVHNPGLVDILSALGSAAQGGASMAAKSDGRAKSDVQTIGHDAKGRRWVSFRYNWEKPGTMNYGVIAQEILKSDPDAVTMGGDGEYWVDYSKLLAVN